MKTSILPAARVLLVVALAVIGGALAADQHLPTDDALARESARQRTRSTSAIDKADRQSARLRQPVPDVGVPDALPAPDPSDIARRYEVSTQPQSGLFILVSLSMPAPSLDRLAAQAGKAGAALVLRGVVDGSLQKTTEFVAGIVQKHPGAQFHIDPTLFRRFSVSQVPAFVLTSRAIDGGCNTECAANGAFARVAGDVTLDYALDYMASHSDKPLASLAERRLRQVRSQP